MRIIILTVILFFVNFVFINAQSITDTIKIPEVKVLAKRKVEEAGLKITRPDSLSRASMLTTNLSELISAYSPVFVKSYGRGSIAKASFRGTAATHTQILWNGMNLNSPMRGFADLALLPVFFTDDVYLLHGGSSMAEGSGALGGSIHLNNQPDWNLKFNLAALHETSSFQTKKSYLKLMLGQDRFKSSTRLFYENSENNFPYFNYGVIPQRNDTLQNADYWKAGVLQEFYYRPFSDKIMALRLWYQKSDRNLPQLMSYEGAKREEYQQDNQFRIQYDWKKYSDILNYHFFSGINSNRLNYYRASPEFNFVNEDSESIETSLINHVRIFREFDEKTYATVSLDANYHHVDIQNNKLENGYKKHRFETSLLVNIHLKPSERFAAFVLVRSENYDAQFVPLIPGAGLEWQFLESFPVILRLNAARNYHKPTLNDLYWLPGGNPDLLPEDGYTGEFSFSGQFEGGLFSFKNEITGFISQIENWIIWQPSASGAYFWEASNVKSVLSRGIEYQFSAGLNWKNFWFRSGGNYSFTNTSNQNVVSSVDESRGKQLIYIPKHKGNLYLAVTFKKTTIKYDLEYVGKRFTKSSNLESDYERVLNPYFLSKVSVDKQFELTLLNLNLKFTVENLF
ncbi:MAG: TonB-dependent receptor, partial [Prolixibacteraceae bacterium]|nr:TonB-dependent receptor [Prolixibacteraceae bacterium]